MGVGRKEKDGNLKKTSVRYSTVDNETDEIIKAVTVAGIIGTLAATVRALLTKNETVAQRVRNFFAGVFVSVLIGYVLRGSALSEMWKEVFIAMSAAFISSVWPFLENIAKKWVQKKGNDVLRNDDN